MLIQVLGTGCPKCRMLAERADQAARELGADYLLEKITDINQILAFGVMTTPALAVDGQVKLMGKVPDVAELKKLLV